MNNVNIKNPIKHFLVRVTRDRGAYESEHVDVMPFDTRDEAEDAFGEEAYCNGVYIDPDQTEFTYGNGAEKDDEWFECTIKLVSTDKYTTKTTYELELA